MYQDRIKELRRVKASELIPSPHNWRQHPQYQRDALHAILDEVGYADAVLARETEAGLEVIDGHLRTSLDGDQTIPVLVLDVTEEEAKKLLLTHDPLAAMAETNISALTALLGDVEFQDESIVSMLAALENGAYGPLVPIWPEEEHPSDEDDEANASDAIKEAEADGYVPFSKRGQVWALGNHRLMCGDSTKPEDMRLLMDGASPALMVADPPYGIDAPGKTLGTGKKHFYRGVWDKNRSSVAFLLKLAPIQIIWGGNYFTDELAPTNDWLCWHKKNDGLSFSEFELAWTNLGKNTRIFAHHWSGEVKAHPTQKPLPVIEWCLGMATGSIIDPFLGSGTTLIACEKLDRICYGMEIEPRYVDVALKRWEAFTGRTAELIE